MIDSKDLHSDLAAPPGEFLEEVVSELGLTEDELARRIGQPTAALSSIYRGTTAITPDMAMQLQEAVGVPANVWLGLESEYRLALAQEAAEEHPEEGE